MRRSEANKQEAQLMEKEERQRKGQSIATDRMDRMIRTGILILILLIIGVASYGAAQSRNLKFPKFGKTDPLGIERILVGSYEGTTTEEDGVWYIDLTVDEDFSFQRAAIQVELPEGAYVSEDTNCLITELGGQYLVNLGVQDAALAITNGEVSRDYLFNINLI